MHTYSVANTIVISLFGGSVPTAPLGIPHCDER
jgi:hypothetical protein